MSGVMAQMGQDEFVEMVISQNQQCEMVVAARPRNDAALSGSPHHAARAACAHASAL